VLHLQQVVHSQLLAQMHAAVPRAPGPCCCCCAAMGLLHQLLMPLLVLCAQGTPLLLQSTPIPGAAGAAAAPDATPSAVVEAACATSELQLLVSSCIAAWMRGTKSQRRSGRCCSCCSRPCTDVAGPAAAPAAAPTAAAIASVLLLRCWICIAGKIAPCCAIIPMPTDSTATCCC
jgi:hypothetical protein